MSVNEGLVDPRRKRAKLNNKLWNDVRHWITFHPEQTLLLNLLSLYDQWRFKSGGKDSRRKKITKDTKLLIDGYRSSANSYMVRCIQQILQGERFWYADHHHSPAMIIRAVSLNVPVLFCIRSPLDSCVSSARRWPIWSVEEAMIHYEKFHNLLLPYTKNMTITDFRYTIKDPLSVLSYMNEKYELGLALDDASIDSALAERPGKEQSEIDAEKEIEKKAKKALEAEFLANGDTALLDRCNEIYQKILNSEGEVFKLN